MTATATRPATKTPKKTADPEPETDITPEKVAHNVLSLLGMPPRYYSNRCTRVFGNNFRINIFITRDINGISSTAYDISESFFVTVDDRGEVLKSNPPITKKY